MDGVLWLVVLVVAGAFLSFSEIAFAAARRTRLDSQAREGNWRARLALQLREQPGRFFTVILIGVNVLGVLGGMLAEAVLAPWFFALMGGSESIPLPGGFELQATVTASVMAFVLVTVAFVLFSDLIPKRIALAAPEVVASRTAWPMQMLISLLRPIAWAFDAFATLIIQRVGIKLSQQEVVTADEILAMTAAAAKSGEVLVEEQTLISKVFALDQRSVTSSMTGREEIIWLDRQATPERLAEVVRQNPRRRFPVCDGQLDRPVGYVDTHDLFSRLLGGEPVALTPDTIQRDLLVFPDTLTLLEALEAFQVKGQDFALIINEYSIVVGLMTLQDVMDTVMAAGNWALEERMIVARDDHSWLIDGLTPVDEVCSVLGIERFEQDENFETLAGFLTWRLRKIPRRADTVEYAGYRFEVVAVDHFRITQVLASRIDPTAPTDDQL
ncbi:MAG: hemolysin family protein [Thioalkalivibrionaceae bacterium]